jgi:tetratricopeptide (TPR) repeat protein
VLDRVTSELIVPFAANRATPSPPIGADLVARTPSEESPHATRHQPEAASSGDSSEPAKVMASMTRIVVQLARNAVDAGYVSQAAVDLRNAAAALSRTRDLVEWADVQSGLGNLCLNWAQQTDDEDERRQHLNEALNAFRQALEVRPKGSLAWAQTQNDLGAVLCRLGDLEGALHSLNAALEVRTRQEHPVQWADTQNNLGLVYEDLKDSSRAEACFISAMEAYRDPVKRAVTQGNVAMLKKILRRPGWEKDAYAACDTLATRGEPLMAKRMESLITKDGRERTEA